MEVQFFVWKRRKCPLLKIKPNPWNKKERGQADVITGMFYVLMVLVVVLFGFRVTQYVITSAVVEDALAASNLASAVIDIKEYGKNHEVYIQDPEGAFLLYREALCHNLQLDEYLNTTNADVLASKVSIEEYTVYNVSGDLVEIYVMDESGQIQEYGTGTVGQTYTPDGVMIETTTVYSRIAFLVKGLLEQTIPARKEKSIDIVRCESE